jgi:predicted metal-dependent HD superfamily phosphohydrolase
MSIDDRQILFYDRWWPLSEEAGWRPGRVEQVGWDLIRRYAGPERHYHNLTHLDECLDALEQVKADCEDPIAVATALWFHDAVYDAVRADNEELSEDLAVERLTEMGETQERITRVRRLILDTAHRTEPSTPDGRLIVDIDLSILGKNPDRFDNYDAAIRLEYAHVPDDAYRRGRAEVLRRFLDRPRIYRTRAFAPLEQPARANLARAIARLV